MFPPFFFMKKLTLSFSSALLMLAPTVALAAFDSPRALLTAVQEQSGRSFSMTVHGASQGTYVTLWANGASEGITPDTTKLRSTATLDVVQGDMKMRAKGEVLVADNMLYAKLNSVNGTLSNTFGSFVLSGYQKQWLSLPFSEGVSPLLSQVVALDIASIDAANADTMYTLQHTMSNGINVYSLNLSLDYAPKLSQSLREMLGDTQPTSSDFFPWRELAEGIHYALVIRTDAQDRFLSSDLTLSTSGTSSTYNATVTEKALNGMVSVSVPKNVINVAELMGMVFPSGESMMMNDLPAVDDMMMDTSHQMVDESVPATEPSLHFYGVDSACTDSSLDALTLVSLQRSGVCPVEKISTRR